jgi:Ca-activated chloride channel family protein
MRFGDPVVLWALLAVPLIALLFVYAAASRRRALSVFSGGPAHLERFRGEVSANRRAAKAIALLCAVTGSVIAAARPQWGSGTETITRKGIDLAIVLDTSKSMAAADVAPSRLARGLRAASSLLDRMEGDRVALVTFAGKPAVTCPLTLDHEAVRLFLDSVDVESVSVPGTALAAAIAEGIRSLGPPSAEGTEAKGRAIIVISDGEDHEGGVEAAIQAAKRSGVVVFGIGCGTDQGAPIPEGESGAYKKDAQGKLITRQVLPGDRGGRGSRGNRESAVRDGRFRLEDRSQDPVGRAIPDSTRRRAPRVGPGDPDFGSEDIGMTRPIALMLLAGVSSLLGGEAHRRTEKGNQLYEKGQNEPALSEYQKAQAVAPGAPQLHYDLGNVLYRQENWAGAADEYEQALGAASPDLSVRAAYNLGNALFHDEKYDEAVKAYTRALRGAPQDGDAKHNLEMALRALEQKKQQQQQQKQDKNDKKEPPKKEDKPQRSGQGDDDKKPKDKSPQGASKDQDKKQGSKPGEMTPDEAKKLLDRLGDQEKQNVKKEQARVPKDETTPEKDW